VRLSQLRKWGGVWPGLAKRAKTTMRGIDPTQMAAARETDEAPARSYRGFATFADKSTLASAPGGTGREPYRIQPRPPEINHMTRELGLMT
jgi:hypothetical protein